MGLHTGTDPPRLGHSLSMLVSRNGCLLSPGLWTVQVSAKSSLTQGPPIPACFQLNSLLLGAQRSSIPHGAGKGRNLRGAIYVLHFISAVSSLYYISAILGCRGFGGLCQAPCSGQLQYLPESMQNENTKLGRGWESQCPLPEGPQRPSTADSRSPRDGNLHAGTHVHTQSLDEWARNSPDWYPQPGTKRQLP